MALTALPFGAHPPSLLLQEYVNAQMKLQDVIKKGLFHLAQSKYGSCGQALGHQSYNLEPHRSMRIVKVDSAGDSLAFKITRRPEGEAAVEDDSEDDFEWPSPSASSNNLGIEDLKLPETDSLSSKQRARKRTANRDPLTWFGLPPRPLKEAKASFEEALEVIASLLSAREELKSILSQSNGL